MRFGIPIALLALIPSLAARAGAQTSAARGWVPLVEFRDTAGRCARISPTLLEPGQQGLLLRFGTADTAQRVASAVWDSTGRLVRYSDARGDLRGPPVPMNDRGARTTVSIDAAKGVAILLNESHGRNLGSVLVPAAAAMGDARLGPPRAMIERLRSECGAP